MIRIGAAIGYTLVFTCLLLVGCGGGQKPIITEETSNTAAFDYPVAQADFGYVMTAQNLYQRLYHSRYQALGGYVEPSVVKPILDSMVFDSLLWFESRELDLRQYWADNWNHRLRSQDLLIQEYIKREVYDQIKSDSQDVVAFYEAHPDIFTVKEQTLAAHIMITEAGLLRSADSLYYRAMSGEELAKAAKNYIDGLYLALEMGVSFEELASTYSHDEVSRREGGHIGWAVKGLYKDPFDSIAFSLKLGQYSQPYWDSDGWHIVAVFDYLPAGPVPMDRPGVYESAKKNLITSRSNEIGLKLLDSLRQEMAVVTNEEILDTVIFDLPDSQWVAVVNGQDTIDARLMKNMEMGYRNRNKVKNSTPDMKREMIRNLSSRVLMAQQARKAGLDTLPEIKEKLYYSQLEAARAVIDRERINVDWRPSDSEIAAYYNSHAAEFTVKKPLTVQHIVTKDSLLAEYIRDQASAGIDFLDLARQFYPGDEAVRDELADLGAIGPNDVDTAFYRVALETPLGTVSAPVKTQYGYHVIKVLKYEPSRGLTEATAEIVTKLTREHRENILAQEKARLFKKYHVKFPKALPRLHFIPAPNRNYDS